VAQGAEALIEFGHGGAKFCCFLTEASSFG
jgi:hypothetical protein